MEFVLVDPLNGQSPYNPGLLQTQQRQAALVTDRHLGPQDEEVGVTKPLLVFLSQTEQDEIKSNYSRPTYWFLTKKLNIRAFLDESDTPVGNSIEQTLYDNANACSHALVFLSPTFRQRKYCVKELNTFLFRVDNEDSAFRLLPVLVNLQDTKGYPVMLKAKCWLRLNNGSGSVSSLVNDLWPRLANDVFKGRLTYHLTPSKCEKWLAEYIDEAAKEGILILPRELSLFRSRQRVLKRTILIGLSILAIVTVVVVVVVLLRPHALVRDERDAIMHPDAWYAPTPSLTFRYPLS